MTTNTKLTTKPPRTSLRRALHLQLVQNFHLVWLGESLNETSDDCRNSIMQLRQAVNTVNTFTDVDECMDLITDIQEKAFMIISGAFSQKIISIVQDIPQVGYVYILSENTSPYEKQAKEWLKVAGVYTDITSICQALKKATQHCDHNSVSFSFVKATDKPADESLDTLHCSFMYTQILKEILLTIDFNEEHINQFLAYCSKHLAGNNVELENMAKVKKEYRCQQPIWWYTYPCFLYSMLNKALRTMEVDLIVKMGFFVRDLHNHIAALYAEQYSGHRRSNSFIVYRGQGLSQADFDQMKKMQGGLLAFNNFLSTSIDRAVSLAFAQSNTADPHLIGVLFEINIDPSITSSFFADIKCASYFQTEQEILFSMHTVFRIGEVKQIDSNDRLWEVKLTLTSDNDPQLQALTKSMDAEAEGSTGWFRLGKLMRKVAQYDQAEQVFEIILGQTTDEKEKGEIRYELAMVKNDQGQYTEALSYHKQALASLQKTLPANHPYLGNSYNGIGKLYHNIGEYSKALSYYEQALEIEQKIRIANDPHIAGSYSNIGAVYDSMGEYSKALSYHEQALAIRQGTLLANHPDLAASYNSIGGVNYNIGEYSKAISSYEQALEIWQKTLPENHPDLAGSHSNIGAVYDNIGEYSKALSCHEQALAIRKKTLRENHPDLAVSYNNIGLVYYNIGEYSKALSSYQQALEIQQGTLLVNHPDLASFYNNIGAVYYNIGEYSKALSCHEQALAIRKKTLPENHLYLATSYNNIGGVYFNIGEYSKALFCHEQALAIRKKTLPENHLHLASSYNNIGAVYDNIGEYSKALFYHEKALAIQENTFPANHPNLAGSYNNIGSVYYNMAQFSKALTYLERALDILQRSVPPSHPHLTSVKNGIRIVKKKV